MLSPKNYSNKHKHWRAFQGIFGPEAAPVLDLFSSLDWDLR
jgi:hypothetical protein